MKQPTEREEVKEKAAPKRRRKCKDLIKPDNFIIPMNSGWKAIFDTFVLFVVAYSIFTTSLYVSFDPVIPETFQIIDEIVFYVFSLDFTLSKSPPY